jgi:hypothetical protein
MVSATLGTSVKVVGANGQISLGKQFAGRQVLIEEREPGCWLIRTAQVIPDNELWLHTPGSAHDLSDALQWASKNAPSDDNVDEVIAALGNER